MLSPLGDRILRATRLELLVSAYSRLHHCGRRAANRSKSGSDKSGSDIRNNGERSTLTHTRRHIHTYGHVSCWFSSKRNQKRELVRRQLLQKSHLDYLLTKMRGPSWIAFDGRENDDFLFGMFLSICVAVE